MTFTITDQPRFVSGNENKQYGQFRRMVSLTVSVYSYPFFHKLEVLKNGVCCVNEGTHVHVGNATVKDRIFEKIVQLKGYEIKVHGFELTGTDFTSYEFRIGNTVDNASYTVTLIAEEKPQSPKIEKVVASTTSLKIFWIKSFDGGTRQRFVLMYKKDTDAAWRNESIRTDNVHVLENLKSDAVYMLRIYSRNDLGDSNFTEPLTIRTLVDLAVENSIYQSFGQNQTQQDEQNDIDQRTVLLSNTENETMYQNAENTFICNEDHIAVENYMYQNQGACGNENVQVNPASRICSRKRNSFATTGNTGISSESTCNENFKIKGKQKTSTMTYTTDSSIQENQSMNYAEVVFDGRSSSQGIVIRGINDRNIYADIDITAVGTQLPENIQAETFGEDDDDDDFMYIDEIVDYRKSKKM
ncbi:unnamed protein product [Mytilus edulis]|uniref:Fibronectin type-III domain-containing protein n=1 Tax=Mytilus edulis TaxID=6550 RepID=A0A8S3QNR8_MYTED|nr:unnamed protein product [Mytilus edulis]